MASSGSRWSAINDAVRDAWETAPAWTPDVLDSAPLWGDDYRPFPKQALFHESTERYVLFGGAAGPGKSEALLRHAIDFCRRHRRVTVALFRRTFPDLEREMIERFRAIVPPALAKYNESKHVARFSNGSRLMFCHCQHESDVTAYQGAQFDMLMFDELTHFTDYQFRYLAFSRLRPSRRGISPRALCTSNPGGVGQQWVKALFVDRDEATIADMKQDPGQFRFIPARLHDNPELMARDPDYEQRLEALPEAERNALLYGDWDSFAGQFFRAWRRGYTTCAPFEIPPEWRRYRAIDYGGTAPFVCLWFAVDPSCDPKRMYVYREYSAAGATLKRNCDEVLRLSADEVYKGTWADPSMFNRTQEQENSRVTLAAQAEKYGLRLDRGYNDRPAGWALMKEVMEPAVDGLPSLIYFDTCTECCKSIPAMVHDKVKVEDMDTHGNDHCSDASRYGICGIAGLGNVTAGKRTGANRDAALARSGYA